MQETKLEVGAIFEGKVTGITKFGAFVDLGNGKTGMVHISEVAPVFVKEIRDFVTEGQTVKVKIIGINEDGKISLSMKALEEEMVDTEPAEDLEQYTSKESFGSSLGSLLAGIKLD